jgi:hypothetical protein
MPILCSTDYCVLPEKGDLVNHEVLNLWEWPLTFSLFEQTFYPQNLPNLFYPPLSKIGEKKLKDIHTHTHHITHYTLHITLHTETIDLSMVGGSWDRQTDTPDLLIVLSLNVLSLGERIGLFSKVHLCQMLFCSRRLSPYHLKLNY